MSEGANSGFAKGGHARVLASAALFAAAHGEPVQFLGLFFLGVVLAVLLWRTKRIIPSVITHVSIQRRRDLSALVYRGRATDSRVAEKQTPPRVVSTSR